MRTRGEVSAHCGGRSSRGKRPGEGGVLDTASIAEEKRTDSAADGRERCRPRDENADPGSRRWCHRQSYKSKSLLEDNGDVARALFFFLLFPFQQRGAFDFRPPMIRCRIKHRYVLLRGGFFQRRCCPLSCWAVKIRRRGRKQCQPIAQLPLRSGVVRRCCNKPQPLAFLACRG